MDEHELKYDFNKLPVCPHCDYEWDGGGELDAPDGDEREYDCPSCGKPFALTCHYDITYSTRKADTNG